MEKKKIQTQYKNYLKLFQKYSKYYFEKNNPLVSDKDFDDLKKKYFFTRKEVQLLKVKKFSISICWI